MPKKLTQRQIYDKLHGYGLDLSGCEGDTVLGDTVIKTLVRDIALLQTAIVASEEGEERPKPSEPT